MNRKIYSCIDYIDLSTSVTICFINCLNVLCITYFISIYSQVYVQHLLKNNKETIWKLIHTDNAHIYICGCVNFRTSQKIKNIITSWDRGIPETILIMLSIIFLLQRCPKHGTGRAECLLWDRRGAGRNESHSSSRLHQETDD